MHQSENSQADANPSAYDTLILGIGNVLWADEGFGVRAVEMLHERHTFPENVRVMDGGTQGIFLLPWVTAARRLLIFDAIDFGLPPSTLRLIQGQDVPRFMGAKKVSMHQAGFQEVLSSADFAGRLPHDLALIGVQPALLDDYGGSLSPQVRQMLGPATSIARKVLDAWHIRTTTRVEPLPPQEQIGPIQLDMSDYERYRPVVDDTTP